MQTKPGLKIWTINCNMIHDEERQQSRGDGEVCQSEAAETNFC